MEKERVIAFLPFLVYYSYMLEVETIIFCNRQYAFMMVMSKLHIARLIKHQGCYDPITKKEVCKRLLLRMPKFIYPIYSKILTNLNDEYGRIALDSLISKGAIVPK